MIVSWRQLLRLLVALAMLLALPLAEAAVRLLDRADLILAPGTTPPPASSAWKPVTLPDQWRQSRPHEMSDQGWYRIHVTLPADFKDPGLKVGEKVAVIWNMKGKVYEASAVTILKG